MPRSKACWPTAGWTCASAARKPLRARPPRNQPVETTTMARRHESDHEAGNDSSFLDVITNCVGILIILVIVVGQRAKNAPVLQTAREATDKLAAARALAADVESEVHALADEMAV